MEHGPSSFSSTMELADNGDAKEESTRDDDFLFYLHKGSDLLQAGQNEEARVSLERAFGLSPKSLRAQNLLGLVYFKLGLFEAAKGIYDQLIEACPDDSSLRVNLGLVLLRQGRLPDAKTMLESAIELSDDHGRAHCYLGLVLFRQGELAKARGHFLKGGAHDFVKKIDLRLSESPEPGAGNREDILKEVGEGGLLGIEGQDQPFCDIESEREAAPKQDYHEAAWETSVAHAGPSLDPATPASSLAPEWELSRSPQADMPGSTPGGEPTEVQVEGGALSMGPPGEEGLTEKPSSSFTEEEDEDEFEDDEPMEEAPLGFRAGPRKRAALRLETTAHLRLRAVVSAQGKLDVQPSTIPSLARVRGPARLVLEVPRFAVALRDVRDLHVLQNALMGFDDGFSPQLVEWEGIRAILLGGSGSLLVDAKGPPTLVPLDGEVPMVVAENALVAWSSGSSPVPLDAGENVRLIQLTGQGYVLVSLPSEEEDGDQEGSRGD